MTQPEDMINLIRAKCAIFVDPKVIQEILQALVHANIDYDLISYIRHQRYQVVQTDIDKKATIFDNMVSTQPHFSKINTLINDAFTGEAQKYAKAFVIAFVTGEFNEIDLDQVQDEYALEVTDIMLLSSFIKHLNILKDKPHDPMFV